MNFGVLQYVPEGVLARNIAPNTFLLTGVPEAHYTCIAHTSTWPGESDLLGATKLPTPTPGREYPGAVPFSLFGSMNSRNIECPRIAICRARWERPTSMESNTAKFPPPPQVYLGMVK